MIVTVVPCLKFSEGKIDTEKKEREREEEKETDT